MKQVLLPSAVMLVGLISCRKESVESSILIDAKNYLENKMIKQDYDKLDLAGATIYSIANSSEKTVRIPMQSNRLFEEFVILRATSNEGKFADGRIITIKYVENILANESSLSLSSVSTASLRRNLLTNTVIDNSSNDLKQSVPVTFSLIVPSSENSLPEVVVVAYVNKFSALSYSTWLRMQTVFYSLGTGATYQGSYYQFLAGSTSSGTTTSSGGSSSGSSTYSSLLLDKEQQDVRTGINVEAYLKCFDQLPDAGSSCSVEILTDIPVDDDPYKLLNLQIGSPGHTFLRFTKKNGTRTVIQNIGFYPKSGWKTTLTNAPIEAKFVDNGNHEFNASLRMAVTPEAFRATLNKLRQMSKYPRYDIDEFNCTDLAMAVFNETRNTKLQIPLYQIPGGMAVDGTSTPQGVYHCLQSLKAKGGSEAQNITIGFIKGWIGKSNGPCN
jgi:hypothetical protein